MTKEKWTKAPGFENYRISTRGRIWSPPRMVNCRGGGTRLKRGRFLKPCPSDNHYLIVNLCRSKRPVIVLIHRLVAEAFIPNPHDKPEVNHKDLNKFNNHADNLEWVTEKENQAHLIANNGRPCGSQMGNSKLTEAKVSRIKRRIENGERPTALAREHGVDKALIYMIKNRRVWKHVK